jgi:UDP-N-acetylglucosamine:LPS N-acetylglucosamine transferase
MQAFFTAVNLIRPDRLTYRPARPWFLERVRRFAPSLVVSVHPMVNHGVAETLARVGLDLPFAIALTDLAPPFWRGWAEPRATVTTAPTPQAIDQLVAWGAHRDRVRLAPIPISPRFHLPTLARRRRAARREMGLDEARLTIAFTAGSASRAAGLRAYQALAGVPADLARRIQAIFVAGRDPDLLSRAERVATPFPGVVLPWRDDPDTILAASDLLFTKPGSLTMSEALAAGVPLWLDGCGGIMPQERGGARWVVAQGAGRIVADPQGVPALLREAVHRPWERFRERARACMAGDAGMVLALMEAALAPSGGPPRASAGPARSPGLSQETALAMGGSHA